MTVKVGDQLWFVPDGRHERQNAQTVIKVGRRWACTDTNGTRFDIDTMRADSDKCRRGQYHHSREDYETQKRANDAWWRLRSRMSETYRKPDAITESKIHQAAELLGFTLTPDAPK